MYGPMPHYTASLTLDITMRADLATAGGLLRLAASTCLAEGGTGAAQSTPPGSNGGHTATPHFFHENVYELLARSARHDRPE